MDGGQQEGETADGMRTDPSPQKERCRDGRTGGEGGRMKGESSFVCSLGEEADMETGESECEWKMKSKEAHLLGVTCE